MDSLENLRVLEGSEVFSGVCNTSIPGSNPGGTSTKFQNSVFWIFFALRKSKGDQGLGDLIKEDVGVITLNPKNVRRSKMELSGGMGVCG